MECFAIAIINILTLDNIESKAVKYECFTNTNSKVIYKDINAPKFYKPIKYDMRQNILIVKDVK